MCDALTQAGQPDASSPGEARSCGMKDSHHQCYLGSAEPAVSCPALFSSFGCPHLIPLVALIWSSVGLFSRFDFIPGRVPSGGVARRLRSRSCERAVSSGVNARGGGELHHPMGHDLFVGITRPKRRSPVRAHQPLRQFFNIHSASPEQCLDQTEFRKNIGLSTGVVQMQGRLNPGKFAGRTPYE